MNTIARGLLSLLLLSVCPLLRGDAASSAPPPPLLHPLFSDHVVLQQGKPVPVWGWAPVGTKVTVRFAGQTRSAIADRMGHWKATLRPLRASSEPRVLTVTGSAPGQTAEAHDVLVGEVWLCSGQSNMEMGIAACDATNDIAQAEFPQVRLLTVPKLVATEPKATLDCRWLTCTPSNILQGTWGGFSATAFFFGRELHRDLKVPVGLIHSSWGGTIAEAWTSPEGLRPVKDFDAVLDRQAQEREGKVLPHDYAVEYEAWCRKNDPGTQQGWQAAAADTAGWTEARMPQTIEQAGMPDFDGIVWERRTVDIPESWAGHDLVLRLGQVDDVDTTWFNGLRVGQMNRFDYDRVYQVPGSAVRAGANVIALRVLDTGGLGGLTSPAERLSLSRADDPNLAPISLAGTWRLRASTPLANLPAVPQPPDPGNPNIPTVLYNGMIAPLVPFAIRGAIWYQGESNAGRAEQYRRLLPALISDWQKRFGGGAFPFYIVQLAAFTPTNTVPRESDWAELREAQALTARNVRNAGLAVAIDIGDAADIHPKNKAEVGRRLARCALVQTYGHRIPVSGPWFKSLKREGAALRLRFDHVDGGLKARGGPLVGFAIAGADRRFTWATARIEGNAVVVSSPEVPHPVAVRYAWDNNPVCNLYNGAGLPAVPFRTDDWPMLTHGKK